MLSMCPQVVCEKEQLPEQRTVGEHCGLLEMRFFHRDVPVIPLQLSYVHPLSLAKTFSERDPVTGVRQTGWASEHRPLEERCWRVGR